MNQLSYIGIMVNYKCTASCRHCLYCSSPHWTNGYITEEKAREICTQLTQNGVWEVHIGGGEPFLDFEGLCGMIGVMNDCGMSVQYIETNGYWCYDREKALEKFRRLKALGVEYVMVSCDPFHAEYIPLRRVLNFIKWCQEADMGLFVWKEQYLRRLLNSGLDPDRPHSRKELEEALGKDYIYETAAEYGLGMNGRALNILEEYGRKKPAEAFLDPLPCPSISRLRSGHVDLDGRFIPSNCTGLGLKLDVVLAGKEEEAYPLYRLMKKEGLAGLYALAKEKGFSPDSDGYPSKCALCYALRAFLLKNGEYDELYPAEYYENR